MWFSVSRAVRGKGRKRREDKGTKCERVELEQEEKAAPGQQGWQSAAVGRRGGGWCRCNSNSDDCREEESPGRDKHRPPGGESDRKSRKKEGERAQKNEEVAERQLKDRSEHRLKQHETGGV